MKKRMFQRDISVLLAFVITFTSLSLESVFAAEKEAVSNTPVLDTALANYDFDDFVLGDDGYLHNGDVTVTLEAEGAGRMPELVDNESRGKVLSFTEHGSGNANRGAALLPENPFAGQSIQNGFTLNFWTTTTGTANKNNCLVDFELAPAKTDLVGTLAFNQGAVYWNVTDQHGDSAFTDFDIDGMNFADRSWKMVTMALTAAGVTFYCNGEKIEHSLSADTISDGTEDYEEILKELAEISDITDSEQKTNVRLGSSMSKWWRGAGALIDDVSFFGKALSEDEVAALYLETYENKMDLLFRSEGYTFSVYRNEAGVNVAAIAGCDQRYGDVVIPEKLQGFPVVGIWDGAFRKCSITSVSLPEGLTSIGSSVFLDCYVLESVNLPKSLTSIGEEAFRGCNGLTSISLPEGLTSLGNRVFSECSGLTSISLPEGLTSIGEEAFYGCSGLASISLPEGLTSIGEEAFSGCNGLTSISLPERLTSIGDYAFGWCSGLTSISLPEGLTSLGDSVFSGCNGLTNIDLPEGLTSIGNSAFSECGLTSISLPEGLMSIGESAFYGCSGLTSISLPEGLTSIGNSAFSRCGLTSISLPEGLTSIGDYAFGWCSGLTSISLPEGLTSIGDYAFWRCDGLISISLPEGLTNLEDGAFSECSGLTSISLPEGLTSIGEEAFYGCNGLISISLPEGLTNIGNSAFRGCNGLTSISLPEGLTSLGDRVFSGCNGLTSIDLPEGLTSIGNCAFDGCSKLEDLYIPESVTNIGDSAFGGCSKLTLVVYPDSYAEEYAITNNIPFRYLWKDERIILNLKSNDGNKLSGSYTVYWYESDSDNSAGIGSTLHNVEVGKSYQYQIALGEELSYQYLQPEMGMVTAQEGDNSVDVILEPIGQISINGTVKDTDGKVIDGASLNIKQTFNSKYEKVSQQSADRQGKFSFSASNVDTLVTVSADGYYNSTYKIMPKKVKDGVYTIDAVLKAMPQSKIELSLSMQYAAAPGETANSSMLLSADNMIFTLYNETQGQEIRDFVVQYPHLVIGEDCVKEGDDIRISAVDEKGQMTAEDDTVKLDGDKCGSAFISFVQNGSVMIESITGNKENLVMVFEHAGKLVQSGNAAASYISKPLPAGKYDVIVIKKSTLFNNIPKIEALEDFGLVEKTDYVKKSVTVSNGEITVIDSVAVPQLDESKLYYTVSDKTYVVAGQSTAVAGKYVTVRAQYEIDPKYVSSNEKVRIEIPDGMALVEGSLTVNGKKGIYSQAGNDIIANVNKSSGAVRFYLLAADTGKQDIHAYLNFKKDEESVLQPIGSASVEVTAAKIIVPEKTGRKSVTASGKATANCKVTVYDNGEPIGETTSNKNGSWSLTFDLVKPLSYSYHSIYAVVTDDNLNINIQTETEGLVYDKGYAEPAKVTMYNTAHPNGSLEPTEFVTVFDFLNPSSVVSNYNYWPQYPTFTFKAEFTGGDTSTLDNVYVVTTDSSGDETYVKCTYDGVTGAWIGTHDYTSFSDVPCSVTVSYEFEREEEMSQEWGIEEVREYISAVNEVTENLANELEASGEITNVEQEDNSIRFNLVYDSQEYATYSLEFLDYSQFSLEAWEEKYGYLVYEDEDGKVFYVTMTEEESGCTLYQAFPDEEILLKQKVQLLEGEQQARIIVGAIFAAWSAWDGIKFGEKAYIYNKLIEGNCDILNSELSSVRKILDGIKRKRNCKGMAAMPWSAWFNADNQYEALRNDVLSYKEDGKLLLKSSILAKATLEAASLGVGKIVKGGTILGKNLLKHTQSVKNVKCKNVVPKKWSLCETLKTWWVKQGGAFGEFLDVEEGIAGKVVGNKMGIVLSEIEDVKEALDQEYNKVYGKVKELKAYIMENIRYDCENDKYWNCSGTACSCGCRTPKNDEPRPEKQPGKAMEDPSGYVYEAVPSNRVEGVKAEIYYYDYAEDEFGVAKEEKEDILWDAENYDQINPQYTDKYGTFGWDVPQGQWLVKFSKDGYYDTDTRKDAAVDEEGYLPVPPPQTEVNTAIISKAAPVVKHVNVYKDEVQIEFSQYMQIDTVSKTNVTVSSGGKQVSGTIAPSNAEYNYEGTVKYASLFAFKPDKPLSDKATVAISNVKNYNGTAMGQKYSEELAVRIKPESIKTSAEVTLGHNDNVQLDIQILPAEAGANQTLTAASYSPSIVSVASETVTADKNGHASIKLNGNLPGKGVVRIALDGTEISSDVAVEVGEVKEQSSIDNGSYTVTLSETSYTYDGKKKEPVVTVENGSATLKKGTDYTVTYKNNTDAGTATVVIEGTGSYTGTLEKTFNIDKAKTTITASHVVKTVSVKANTFSLKAKCSRECSLTYSSNNKKIKVNKKGMVTIPKNFVGKTEITIKAAAAKNYEAASKKIIVTVNPAGVKLTSVKSALSGKLTAKWKKNAKASGYEIQYSTSNKFVKSATKTKTVKKASKTSETISGLKKGKTYYSRIRTYKKVSGKTYYSNWSGNKKVKVKR